MLPLVDVRLYVAYNNGFQKKKKRETGKEKRRKRSSKKKSKKMLPDPNISKNESLPFDNQQWRSGVFVNLLSLNIKINSINTSFTVV
jgi:hypothetical protein